MRWLARATAIFVLAVALLFVGAYLLRSAMNEAPFVLNIRPNEDGASVQFSQPVRALVSPEFQVAMRDARSVRVELVSDDAIIPQGSIEFCDTTILPGRFRIRIGGSEFDVMKARILVDGTEHDWLPEPD